MSKIVGNDRLLNKYEMYGDLIRNKEKRYTDGELEYFYDNEALWCKYSNERDGEATRSVAALRFYKCKYKELKEESDDFK